MVDKQQVFSLVQANRLNEAKAQCAALCERDQTDADAWFLLAGIHAQLGALDEVVRCCRQVIAIDPMRTAALYNLGVALQTQSRTEEAAEAYRQVLAIEPENTLALANAALALRELGQRADAMDYCQQALRLQPERVEARNTMGLLFKDDGRIEEAVRNFQQAISLRPQYAEAHFNLGLCHQERADLPAAEACFRQAIQWRPDYVEAHRRLGGLLQIMERPDDAAVSLRRVVALMPDSAEDHEALASVLALLRKWDDAIAHFRRAIELKPDYLAAYNNLANALLDGKTGLDFSEEAEACFRQALRYQPDSAEILRNLAWLLADLGRYEEAEACYRRSLELEPGNLLTVAGWATMLEHKGDFDGGFALVEPLITAGTGEVRVALSYAALATHKNCRAEAAAVLERFVNEPMSVQSRVDLHFSLGKLFDELKQYQPAFEHYHLGNTLHRKQFSEQVDLLSQFDTFMAKFSPEWISRRPRASNRSKLPVFIVGMPRSGTSLVEQILACHPLVHGAGELRDIFLIAKQLPEVLGTADPYPQCLDRLTRKNIDAIAQKHLDRLGGLARDVVRVTDKMPHNFMFLGLIDLLFPGARVIHCRRDPVDTCLSIYFQQFNSHHLYAFDLGDLGRYYRQYQRLMAHWRSVVRIPMMEIRYEDLVENQEALSRQLVEFCGLEWDERCLSFHQSKRVVRTASYDQVRRPMYRKSVARWKHYESFLGPLLAALGEQVSGNDR